MTKSLMCWVRSSMTQTSMCIGIGRLLSPMCHRIAQRTSGIWMLITQMSATMPSCISAMFEPLSVMHQLLQSQLMYESSSAQEQALQSLA